MTEHHIPLCAEIDRLRARVKELEAERDADRRREYGYSQETVDALTVERDKLEEENKKYHEWVSAINKYEAWKKGALARAALEYLEGKAAEHDHR